MADYGYCSVGKWKAGQASGTNSTLVVLDYDQTSHAYIILTVDYEDFLGWAATTFFPDIDDFTDPQFEMEERGMTIDVTPL